MTSTLTRYRAAIEQLRRWTWEVTYYYPRFPPRTSIIYGSRKRVDRIVGRRLTRWQAAEDRRCASRHEVKPRETA